MTVTCAFPSSDLLGEGPVWCSDEQALYWVDIQRPALQRWHPETGAHAVWSMPSRIGSFALRAGGGALAALETGYAFVNFQSGAVTPLADPEPGRPTRFNDGKCDRRGRFWAGTMDLDEKQPLGSLYRLDPDGRHHALRRGATVSNGLGWSPDNRTMYYTDSPTRTIVAFDFDLEAGTISNERVFARDDIGFPDGLTVDAEGYVWSAKWDGWRVVRYTPDGSIDRVVDVPVQRPTSCTFGGPDLRRLYITSARTGLSAARLARTPLAGSVLSFDAGVPGLPDPRFEG